MPLVVDIATVEEAGALISVDRYRAITGDTTSDSGDVAAALGIALELIEEYLGRRLLLAQHTELLQGYRGKVYPTNTPVLYAQGYTIRQNALIGAFDAWDWTNGGDTLVEVTYTGGFDSNTLPTTIQVAIARAAESILATQTRSTSASLVTSGQEVNSVSVGDVRVSYSSSTRSSSSTSTAQELPEIVRLAVKAYRRRGV